MKKNKLVIILLLIVSCIYGSTSAFFSDNNGIDDNFKSPGYGDEKIDYFVSPKNWKPGDKIDKVIKIKNTGNMGEAVRLTYEEKWVGKRGSQLPLKQGDNVAAIIHFINSDDWTRVDNVFYYNYQLAPFEETSALVDYVMFNPLVNASTTCTEKRDGDLHVVSCKSNGEGYDGAKYTLKFITETVQYDMYKEAWNTDISILENH